MDASRTPGRATRRTTRRSSVQPDDDVPQEAPPSRVTRSRSASQQTAPQPVSTKTSRARAKASPRPTSAAGVRNSPAPAMRTRSRTPSGTEQQKKPVEEPEALPSIAEDVKETTVIEEAVYATKGSDVEARKSSGSEKENEAEDLASKSDEEEDEEEEEEHMNGMSLKSPLRDKANSSVVNSSVCLARSPATQVDSPKRSSMKVDDLRERTLKEERSDDEEEIGHPRKSARKLENDDQSDTDEEEDPKENDKEIVAQSPQKRKSRVTCEFIKDEASESEGEGSVHGKSKRSESTESDGEDTKSMQDFIVSVDDASDDDGDYFPEEEKEESDAEEEETDEEVVASGDSDRTLDQSTSSAEVEGESKPVPPSPVFSAKKQKQEETPEEEKEECDSEEEETDEEVVASGDGDRTLDQSSSLAELEGESKPVPPSPVFSAKKQKQEETPEKTNGGDDALFSPLSRRKVFGSLSPKVSPGDEDDVDDEEKEKDQSEKDEEEVDNDLSRESVENEESGEEEKQADTSKEKTGADVKRCTVIIQRNVSIDSIAKESDAGDEGSDEAFPGEGEDTTGKEEDLDATLKIDNGLEYPIQVTADSPSPPRSPRKSRTQKSTVKEASDGDNPEGTAEVDLTGEDPEVARECDAEIEEEPSGCVVEELDSDADVDDDVMPVQQVEEEGSDAEASPAVEGDSYQCSVLPDDAEVNSSDEELIEPVVSEEDVSEVALKISQEKDVVRQSFGLDDERPVRRSCETSKQAEEAKGRQSAPARGAFHPADSPIEEKQEEDPVRDETPRDFEEQQQPQGSSGGSGDEPPSAEKLFSDEPLSQSEREKLTKSLESLQKKEDEADRKRVDEIRKELHHLQTDEKTQETLARIRAKASAEDAIRIAQLDEPGKDIFAEKGKKGKKLVRETLKQEMEKQKLQEQELQEQWEKNRSSIAKQVRSQPPPAERREKETLEEGVGGKAAFGDKSRKERKDSLANREAREKPRYNKKEKKTKRASLEPDERKPFEAHKLLFANSPSKSDDSDESDARSKKHEEELIPTVGTEEDDPDWIGTGCFNPGKKREGNEPIETGGAVVAKMEKEGKNREEEKERVAPSTYTKKKDEKSREAEKGSDGSSTYAKKPKKKEVKIGQEESPIEKGLKRKPDDLEEVTPSVAKLVKKRKKEQEVESVLQKKEREQLREEPEEPEESVVPSIKKGKKKDQGLKESNSGSKKEKHGESHEEMEEVVLSSIQKKKKKKVSEQEEVMEEMKVASVLEVNSPEEREDVDFLVKKVKKKKRKEVPMDGDDEEIPLASAGKKKKKQVSVEEEEVVTIPVAEKQEAKKEVPVEEEEEMVFSDVKKKKKMKVPIEVDEEMDIPSIKKKKKKKVPVEEEEDVTAPSAEKNKKEVPMEEEEMIIPSEGKKKKKKTKEVPIEEEEEMIIPSEGKKKKKKTKEVSIEEEEDTTIPSLKKKKGGEVKEELGVASLLKKKSKKAAKSQEEDQEFAEETPAVVKKKKKKSKYTVEEAEPIEQAAAVADEVEQHVQEADLVKESKRMKKLQIKQKQLEKRLRVERAQKETKKRRLTVVVAEQLAESGSTSVRAPKKTVALNRVRDTTGSMWIAETVEPIGTAKEEPRDAHENNNDKKKKKKAELAKEKMAKRQIEVLKQKKRKMKAGVPA